MSTATRSITPLSTPLFSSLLSTKRSLDQDRKLFSSRKVRKLAIGQFLMGVFLVVLQLGDWAFYGEGYERIFGGGFLSRWSGSTVVMVIFYWVTGVSGVLWASPIRSRCSIFVFITVILISSILSMLLIINSSLGFVYLTNCLPHNSTIVELTSIHNCTSLYHGGKSIGKFIVSIEKIILAIQLFGNFVYVIFAAIVFYMLFREMYNESDLGEKEFQPNTETYEKDNHNVINVAYSAFLCCVLHVWSLSCNYSKHGYNNHDIPMDIGLPIGRKSDPIQDESTE